MWGKAVKRSVTLKDIAEIAGVSKATVSKALREEADISLETQQRVKRIAKSMGYSPNNLAIYLRNGTVKAIGVLVPDNTNPYNALILKGVEAKAQEAGYIVIIANTNSNAEREKEILNSFISMKLEGILSIPTWLENYCNIDIPFILMSRFPYHEPYISGIDHKIRKSFNYVVNDDFLGEYMAAEHLIQQGYRELFLILGSTDESNAEGIMNLTRMDGFKKALSDYGMPSAEDHIISNINTLHESYRAVFGILSKYGGPVGLCLNTDYLATAAFSAACDMGISIPERLGIVGYDDIESAKYLTPALTTVNQSKFAIGSQSVEHLINGRYSSGHTWQKVLAPTLCLRKSTMPQDSVKKQEPG